MNSAATRVTAACLYPATITSGLLLAYYLLFPLNLPLFSILLPLALGFAVVGIMERLQPYRAEWNIAQNDLATDAGYIGINVALREAVNVFFKLGIIAAAAAAGLSAQALELWPTHWHPLLQVLPALLIFDFFEYWFHRCSHRYRFLWRFHAVHHSPKRLYFFNAARFHFVDWIVLSAIEVAVLLVMGADPKVIALCVVFIQIHGLFQHANIELKLGPLNYLVSGPELHRWHHSKIVAESDKNFGNNVIVWDLLFGSYFLPKDRQVGVIGLLNPNYPTGYWQQLKAAFAKTPVDKPADYYQRQAHYAAALAEENAMAAAAEPPGSQNGNGRYANPDK